jgi:hypothetical protein
MRWNPIYYNDFKLNDVIDPLELIRYKVFQCNESWDIFADGGRGVGKSSLVLGLALKLEPRLLDMGPHAALNKCWSFTTEERNQKAAKLCRGSVLVQDEQGTQWSGSSHKWNSSDNQQFADEVQLNRTDGVIGIGISLDDGRVINRVRNAYRVKIKPIRKLSHRETGNGMQIECILTEVVENPFPNSDNDKYTPKYFNYSHTGRISRVWIPHPPKDYWNEYSKRRAEFREQVRLLSSMKKGGKIKQDGEQESYDERILRLSGIYDT